MILYIIRHAWAEGQGDAWPDDSQRPLTEEGRERFAAMIKLLADRGFAPEVIATSPLVRCVQTAEIVARHSPGKPAIVQREELKPGSDLEGMLLWTRKGARDREEVAWVGHAPDVNHMAAALVGDSTGAIRLAKGGIAAVRFDGPPASEQGKLWWLVSAKILGC